jgi:hypothetical protein
MSFLLPILAGCALLAADEPDKPKPLRYLRPVMDRYVPESEVTTTPTDDGAVYVSRTGQGREQMTLTLRLDRDGRVFEAEAAEGTGDERRSAVLKLGEKKGSGEFKRAGITDFLRDLPADPVVTTAPDWSDVFQLVRRYNAGKGGKQKFSGVWIHPVKGLQTLTFSVERLGTNTVTVREKEKETQVKLDRYRMKLRSGDYLVWADPSGRVVKLQPADDKGPPVVLEGFQRATEGLGS